MQKQALYEKYRPRTWSDIVGQDEALKKVLLIRQRNECSFYGKAFWISGYSGTGKTSLAYLIADDAADRFELHEFVGRDLSITDVREKMIRNICSYAPMYGKGKVILVNEAQGMSKPVKELLYDLLEKIAQGYYKNVVVIFTKMDSGEDNLFGDELEEYGY